MRRYPEYKESGVEWIGEIPSHWRKSRLKYESLVPVQYGLNISSDFYVEQGIRFIRTTDITDGGDLIDKGVYLETESVEKIYLTQPNDFLISRSGTLGRTYLHQSDKKYAYGGYLVRFNFGCSVKSRFIFYFTKSQCFEHWIALNTVQSTIGNVNGQKYANLEIPLPSFCEQTQIVNFLDRKTRQIDELIHIKERQVELLYEYRASLINQTVTKGLDPNVEMKPSGVEWIGEIPTHFAVKRLKYIADLNMGQSPPSEEYNSDQFGTPFLQGNAEFGHYHPTPKIYCPTAKKHTSPGDILLSVRAPVGAINVADQEYGIGRGLCAIRPRTNQLECRYARYLLEVVRTELYIVANGTTYDAVTVNDVSKITCVVPPLAEQKEIADFLDRKTGQIDELIALEVRKIELLKEYRQSLISHVVSGKIDVRVDTSDEPSEV